MHPLLLLGAGIIAMAVAVQKLTNGENGSISNGDEPNSNDSPQLGSQNNSVGSSSGSASSADSGRNANEQSNRGLITAPDKSNEVKPNDE